MSFARNSEQKQIKIELQTLRKYARRLANKIVENHSIDYNVVYELICHNIAIGLRRGASPFCLEVARLLDPWE